MESKDIGDPSDHWSNWGCDPQTGGVAPADAKNNIGDIYPEGPQLEEYIKQKFTS